VFRNKKRNLKPQTEHVKPQRVLRFEVFGLRFEVPPAVLLFALCSLLCRQSPAASNCFSAPGSCGYPDPAFHNVGVPAGVTLTPSGGMTITTPGTVIDSKDVTGSIEIQANNVVIKNTRITVTGGGCGTQDSCGNSAIHVGGAYTVTISSVELTTDANTTVEHAIRNANGGTITVDHVYQHGNIDSLCNCGNATIRDTYSIIHLAMANDHLENTYSDGSALTIDHNTFLNTVGQTANIFANTNNGSGGACSNKLTINNNLLAGGGYSIYPCGNASSAGTSAVSITNNRFARCGGGTEVQGAGGTWLCPNGADSHGYFPRAGDFGVEAYSFSNEIWKGNFWDDTLQTFCGDRSSGCAGTAPPPPPPPPSGSACDVNGDSLTNVVDVQQEVNQALGIATCKADINKDGQCTVIDVQRVVNAALGGQCVSP
jgi:hypothetical protein